jgi:hypothetical protein
MYFARSYNLKGAWVGIVLIPPPSEGDVLKYASLISAGVGITGLQVAKDLSIQWLLIRGNSQLVAKQVQKKFDYNIEKMAEYLAEVRIMEKFFYGFEVRVGVPLLNNCDTNHLAWIASPRAPTPTGVIVERLSNILVKAAESSEGAIGRDLMVIDEPEQEQMYDWMHPIKMFLESQLPLDNNAEVEHIAQKSK